MAKRSVNVIRISPPQKEFVESQAWITGFTGGRGAGKTAAGCINILWNATDGENIMAVSPTYPIAKETTFKTFLDFAQEENRVIRSREHPTPFCIFRTFDRGRAEISFKSADNPDSLVGRSVSRLWFDEASLTAQESFERALGCARHRGSMGKIYATFTPRGFKHWTFERFYELIEDPDRIGDKSKLTFFNDKAYLQRPNTKLIHCPSSRNPFLSEEFVPLMSQSYSNRLQLQELEGMFLEIEGLMFARKNARFVDNVPIEAERVRYIDKASSIGEDACFSAMGLIGRSFDGRWFIEDMVRGRWTALDRNRVMRQVLEEDARRYGGTVLTYIEQEGGSAGKEVNEDLIRQFSQFPIYTDSAISSAMRTVGGVILPGDVKVRRASPLSAQWEAGNVFMKKAEWNGPFLDELCVREDTKIRFWYERLCIEAPICTLPDMLRKYPDLRVKVRGGSQKIRHVQCTGRAGIWILSTGGREIFATKDHPIWCENANKFMPLHEFQPGDRVLVHDDYRRILPEIVQLVAFTGQVKPVWNMEVEEQNEYFANGILTHNCMFPEYKFCDQVDAISAGMNKLSAFAAGDSMTASRYNVPIAERPQHGSALYLPKAAPASLDALGEPDYRSSRLPWL
jgi:phage terminase large subunit-like protein